MIAEILHIPPWDIGKLTIDEFRSMIAWLDTRLKEDD